MTSLPVNPQSLVENLPRFKMLYTPHVIKLATASGRSQVSHHAHPAAKLLTALIRNADCSFPVEQ